MHAHRLTRPASLLFRVLTVGACLAGTAALGACVSTPCTAASSINGFTIRYQPKMIADQYTVSLRTCLDGSCQTDTQGDVQSPAEITVPELKGPASATVQVTVFSSTGARLGGGTTEVTPRLLQPNGPGCGPNSWFADLTASRTGLVPTPY